MPTALRLDADASHASCSDANPLSNKRMRTVPIDGIREKATQYFRSSIDSLYNDVQHGGIVPGVRQEGNQKANLPVGSSWRRERDSNPREPFRALYAFQAYLFNRSSTSPQ